MRSPVPQEVSDELRRVVERWRQLPLDHALSRMPLTLGLVQALADRAAGVRGAGTRVAAGRAVPDLGPAVVMDQLTVMVYDLCAADPALDPASLATELSGIRQAL